MLTALLRLFAIRPILAGTLLGIPILTLILLGLAAAVLLKVVLFVVIPVTVAWWIVKRIRRASVNEPVQTV